MSSLRVILICLFMLLGFCISGFALQVGDTVPQFQAISTAGMIDLKQVLQGGPVVLAMYYADFTPV